MRMDRLSGSTAADLLGQASERELADLIFEYGEERFSRRIARKLVEARTNEPIVTTGRLASLVRQAVPVRGYSRIDPATRTFQALRIWVNRELEGLDRFVVILAQRLKAAARLVVISFHSLEDRIVKHTFRALQHEARGTVLTKKPVIAGEEEREQNPRARSAKLRAIEGVA
jgi:16S rRNA (cytosine1402-N4)-methyltransferase